MLKGKDTSPPGVAYMTPQQTAQYLSDLRHVRPARPSGARPPPLSKFNSLRRAETDNSVTKASHDDRSTAQTSTSTSVVPDQKVAHRRTESDLARQSVRSSVSPFAGRPLAMAPGTTPSSTPVEVTGAATVRRTPSMSYMERGTRWMEKQETKSLRQALEDMDLEEERRIHAAAQDEAAELVWKHNNPEPTVFSNPDLRKDYRSHLRKGSYQRSHNSDATSAAPRSASDGSQTSTGDNAVPKKRVSFDRKVSLPMATVSVQKRRQKSYDHLAEAVAIDIANANRRTSSGSKRILSGDKKMFMHPSDRIWEDPQEDDQDSPTQELIVAKERTEPQAQAQPLPSFVRKNPFARVRAQHDRMERSNSAPTISTLPPASAVRHERVEVQRNAPSQSRNPWYMSNEPLPPTPPSNIDHAADEVAPKSTPTKDGKEIRSDDIRAATSKTRKDYSTNLPRPTVVSDKPGRPIVSFEKNWGPKEVVMKAEQAPPLRVAAERQAADDSKLANSPEMALSSAAVSQRTPQAQGGDVRQTIPTVNFPDESAIPSIIVLDPGSVSSPAAIRAQPPPISVQPPSVTIETPSINVHPPTINVNSPEDVERPAQRPLPSPSSRPLPRHAATAPVASKNSVPHFTPSIRQSGILCAQCALPIAGRILSAAGQRFHPGCFVCHTCNTNLECVAFYPEPEQKRDERLQRIFTRLTGDEIPTQQNTSERDVSRRQEAEDGDQTFRFYCHLDFHEHFSPRCKSCKTPIEGEVIVACGAEWHVGHFFCAQCGDPFDSSMPFVEKDGYAWCVGCHTNRYSSKCRKCKKPVTDVVIKALGSDWHGACFVCTECNGDFQAGKYFLRGESQDPVCVRCEERRLKA